MSAIAAFLVLSTPAAFAQEAPTITMTPPVAAPTAPTPQTPPTVAEPSTTAPVAAPQAAQPVAPKPVIRVPLDIAPAESTPVAEAAERAAPAPKRAERAAPRAKAAAVAAAAPAAAATTTAARAATTEAPSTDGAVPIAAPVAAPVEPVAEAAPVPAEKSASTGSEMPWELVGGAAALLLAAGTGLAFARRRRADDMIVEHAPVYADEPETAPMATGEARPWVTPTYAPREDIAPRTVPAFAAAPSGSMGRHEAMAMAGPTPDNPFATLNKRLKRARFLDRQERLAYEATLGQQKDMTRKPVSAWEISQRPAAPAVPEQEVRRPEPARGRPDLRPGFARN